mgnify:CR=1 FL=1
MNKKILLTTIVFTMVGAFGLTFAADNASVQEQKNLPQKGEFQGPPPRGEFGKHHRGDMKKFHPSKAEMEKKKAEFEKRLKLTDEQKKQIEASRKIGLT